MRTTASVTQLWDRWLERPLEIVGLDNALPKMLATSSCIGNIACVALNIATWVNVETDNWYPFIKDPKAKVITALVQDTLMLTYGICMPITDGIYQWVDGQNHS